MLLDTGKKTLACVCKALGIKDAVSDVSCIYLQAEKVNPRDPQQDKCATLFSGKSNSDNSRSLPCQDLTTARMKFINSAVPEGIGDQFALQAMRATLNQERKAGCGKTINI